VTFQKGRVRTASKRVVVPLNSTVRLRVTSDVADEVHVHGVDEYIDLKPGTEVVRDVVARIPGTFEVELHDAGDLLFTLQVRP
jgi:heme/copper-type cytochrome/quinol oxidase subunit 2